MKYHCEAVSTPHSHPSLVQIFASGSCFQIPLDGPLSTVMCFSSDNNCSLYLNSIIGIGLLCVILSGKGTKMDVLIAWRNCAACNSMHNYHIIFLFLEEGKQEKFWTVQSIFHAISFKKLGLLTWARVLTTP